jgi:trigger factor
MKATLLSKEGNIAQVEMVFTGEEFEDAIVEAYKKNKDRFVIDGFRKGKAPRKIIENHYGQDIFFEEALNDMLDKGYPVAVDEVDIEVIDMPKLSVSELKKGEDVVITATVPCFPEVEVKDYFGIKVDKVETVIGDEEVDRELGIRQRQQSRMETVEDRASQEGDTVIFDFDGSIDGEAFDGGKAENYELKLGSGQFIPGFEEQLEGHKSGDDIDVKVTFPEDYHAADLAGKEALFKCKLHEIKTEILPEIDDDFASDISEFETLAELKEDIKKNLTEKAKKSDEEEMKNSMLEKFRESNPIETPNVMIEDELNRMMQEMEQQMMYQGFGLDQYLQMLGMTRDDIKNDRREDAKNSVDMRILLRAVVRQENIEATEEDIQAELESFADNYGQTVEAVKELIGEDNMKYFINDIKVKNAIDAMFDKAKITKPRASKKAKEEKADEE